MIRRQHFPILVALFAVGCSDGAACGKTSSTGACKAIVAQQQQLVRKLPSPCKVRADCACYAGGTPATHCGDYASKGTAAKLDALTRRYVDGRCSPSLDCAPRLCDPGCVRGRCAERPRSAR